MIALDTNILIYASERDDAYERDERARMVLERLAHVGAIIPVQVIAEYLNATRRKVASSLNAAAARARYYTQLYSIIDTKSEDCLAAAQLADRHSMQFFDALIFSVSQRAGATLLLSEDMHDGLMIGATRIINPFETANVSTLDNALSSLR